MIMITAAGASMFGCRRPQQITKSPIGQSAALPRFSVKKFNHLNCLCDQRTPDLCAELTTGLKNLWRDARSRPFWTRKPGILVCAADQRTLPQSVLDVFLKGKRPLVLEEDGFKDAATQPKALLQTFVQNIYYLQENAMFIKIFYFDGKFRQWFSADIASEPIMANFVLAYRLRGTLTVLSCIRWNSWTILSSWTHQTSSIRSTKHEAGLHGVPAPFGGKCTHHFMWLIN